MFTIFTMAIAVGFFLPAKRASGTLALLGVLVAALLAFSDPPLLSLTGHHRSAAFRWASVGGWTGLLVLPASLLGTLYKRRAVSRARSCLKEPQPVSLPYDLLLATVTQLTRIEMLVKRCHPLQKGGVQASIQGNQESASPAPMGVNQAY